MRRRLVAALAAFWLLSMMPMPVAAVPSVQVADPAPPPAVQRNCQNGAPQWFISGQSTSSPNYSRSGISATIDPILGEFDSCLNGGVFPDDGVEAMVQLEPRIAPAGCTTGNNRCAISVGITVCRFASTGACTIQYDDPHFFYRVQGCGQTTGVVNLGDANWAKHTYVIYLDTNFNFIVQIDGQTKLVIPRDGGQMGCWAAGNRKANFQFRKKDGGDSLASSSTLNPSRIMNAKYGLFNQGWFSVGWSTGNCEYQAFNDVCKRIGPDMITGNTP